MASRIERIVGSLHGGTDVFTADAPVPYTSTDPVVLMAARTAFALRAKVKIETFSPQSRVIKRFEAFDVPNTSPIAPRRIARLATQWRPLENRHVLEVFIQEDGPFPAQYFALDPVIQEICHAAAQADARIEYDLEDKNLVALLARAEPR